MYTAALGDKAATIPSILPVTLVGVPPRSISVCIAAVNLESRLEGTDAGRIKPLSAMRS
jgi:hypothetical protein